MSDLLRRSAVFTLQNLHRQELGIEGDDAELDVA
jgi:hypothetical protein